jgi:PAS domain S-box-containing protein
VISKFANISLRTKLILAFVLVSGFSISLVTFTSYLTIRSNLETSVSANLKAQAQARAQDLGNLLSKQINIIEGFVLSSGVQDLAISNNFRYSTDPAIRETQLRGQDLAWKSTDNSTPLVWNVLNGEVVGRLRDFLENFPSHSDALLTDKYGAAIAAVTRPINYYQGDEDWWQAAYAQGKGAIYISQPFFDPTIQTMRLIIAVPVYSSRKVEVLGVMRTIFNAQDIIQLLAAFRPGPTGEFDLLLPSGQLLIPGGGLLSTEPNSLMSLQGTVTSDNPQLSFAGTLQLVSQAPVASPDPESAAAFKNLNWILVARLASTTAFATVNDAGRTALISTLAVLILIVGSAFLVAHWLIAPISRLTAVATHIAGGNLAVKARVEAKDEIGTLASTFNTMLVALADDQQELQQLFQEVDRQKADLEVRVAQRTEELNDLNQRLVDELSERQRLVQSLVESEARFRLLFASSPDAILLVNPYDPHVLWSIVDCNEVACSMNGYTREELIGQPLDLLNGIPSDPIGSGISMKEMREQGVINKETVHRHKDGHFFPVEYATTILSYEGHELIMGIDRDITERKQSEKALQEAKQIAEAASQAKSEFLSRMSHELRTPMNAILGFAQLLNMSRKEPLSPRQTEHVKQIVKGGQHLLDLINEILDISRIEAGRLQFSPEPVPVRESIQEVIDLTTPLASNRNIQLQFNLLTQAKPFVMADRQRLKQVLLNLMSNAVKYNQDDGRVNICCDPTESDGWRISVSDTGAGISPDNLERLFTPFERLTADQTNVEGTGLGLALAKRLVELMHGSIGVDSILGQGSTFWIELPSAESQLDRLQRKGGTGPLPALSAHTRLILYVEDNIANYELIQQVLADYSQIKLLWATDPATGIELARKHHPDLILLDLHLGGKDGAEVLQALKQDSQTAKFPVVIISADATHNQIERLTMLGATKYLTKPIDVKHFIQLIEELLSVEGQ